jgi:uncharacterized membrane-anchored protein
MPMAVSRPVLVALVCVLQAALVLSAVAPRLSARLFGDEYRLEVGPIDPIDPFRGAYVALTYPDLPRAPSNRDDEVFVPLVQDGDVWRGRAPVTVRPASGPYLACKGGGFELSCGIESFFASEAEARRIEDELRHRGAIAVVRIDRNGNAALISVE